MAVGMQMTTTQEFIQEHAPDGVMTPQQAAQLLELAQGDTGAPAALETDGVPGAVAAVEPKPQAVQAPEAKPAAEPDPANTVILARDGKHTISYDKLVEAREAKQQAEARTAELEAQLQALQAQQAPAATPGQSPEATAQTNAAVAQAAIDQGVDLTVFGDFSEEAIAKGVQALTAKEVERVTAQLRAQMAEMAELVKPMLEKQQVDTVTAHHNAVREAHPDIDSIAESKELLDWIAGQPSFARAGYEATYQNGDAGQVIELLNAFKSANGKTPAAAPPLDAKAAAKAIIAKLPAQVPASLSDIPGGTAGPASRFEALAGMSPLAKLAAMEEMSPAQQQAYLNRRM